MYRLQGGQDTVVDKLRDYLPTHAGLEKFRAHKDSQAPFGYIGGYMGVEVYLSFFFSPFLFMLTCMCNRMIMTDLEVDLCRFMAITQPLPASRPSVLPLKLRTATQPESIACVVVPRDGISTILSWNECTRID